MIHGYDEQNKWAQSCSWRNHIRGELALVTSQPPEAYILGYPHQFFVDGRFHFVRPLSFPVRIG